MKDVVIGMKSINVKFLFYVKLLKFTKLYIAIF